MPELFCADLSFLESFDGFISEARPGIWLRSMIMVSAYAITINGQLASRIYIYYVSDESFPFQGDS